MPTFGESTAWIAFPLTPACEILNEVDPTESRLVFADVFRCLQRGKVLEPFVFWNNCYLLSLDGEVDQFDISARFYAFRHQRGTSAANTGNKVNMKYFVRTHR